MHAGEKYKTIMYPIIYLLYNGIFIPLLYLAAVLAALFDRKIRRGLLGRRYWHRSLREKIGQLPEGLPRIWVHISSLGEFEQAKPVLQQLMASQPRVAVILSFYSPSGFDHAQKTAYADIVTYLPVDTWWSSRRFIATVNPGSALVVRHDVWPNYQWRLRRLGIPSILMDASISPQRRQVIRLFRIVIRTVFETFDEILATTEESVPLFRWIVRHPERIRVMGDTRYDQVCVRARETGRIEDLIRSGVFVRQHCLVAGSTWPQDEKVLLPAIVRAMTAYPEFTCIIAPHEIDADHLDALSGFFRDHGIALKRLSQFRQQPEPVRVLLVDHIGLLANLYALGALAFVGGGYGAGIHSVLEPAAHGAAIYFGPRHGNSLEALALIRQDGGRCVRTSEEMHAAIGQMFSAPQRVAGQGQRSFQMVSDNVGASARTVEVILHYLSIRRSMQHG